MLMAHSLSGMPGVYTDTNHLQIHNWIVRTISGCRNGQLECLSKEDCPYVNDLYTKAKKLVKFSKPRRKIINHLKSLVCDKKQRLFCCSLDQDGEESEVAADGEGRWLAVAGFISHKTLYCSMWLPLLQSSIWPVLCFLEFQQWWGRAVSFKLLISCKFHGTKKICNTKENPESFLLHHILLPKERKNFLGISPWGTRSRPVKPHRLEYGKKLSCQK